MLHQKINEQPAGNIYNAMSLIEILISLLIATVVLLILGNYYSYSYKINQKYSEQLFLQRESHHLLSYFEQHIQHIGYLGYPRLDSNQHFFQHQQRNYYLDTEQCLLFFYDLNKDGCIGNRRTKHSQCLRGQVNHSKDVDQEMFGVKLQNQELYTTGKNQVSNCRQAQCQSLLMGCNQINWIKFTEREKYRVQKLLFKWIIPNKLLSIRLILQSAINTDIQYETSGEIYLLNSQDE